jgi:predicted nucleic acid-binding protein
VFGVIDSSVLINFLKLGRTELLAGLTLAATTHVEAEITTEFPDQLAGLRAAVTNGHVTIVDANQPQELALFAALVTGGRLGQGECSAIAVAVNRKCALVIDDRRAITEARRYNANLSVIGTGEILASLVRTSVLTVAEADKLINELANSHKFRLRVSSIKELL